jgi:hypothetical protein
MKAYVFQVKAHNLQVWVKTYKVIHLRKNYLKKPMKF